MENFMEKLKSTKILGILGNALIGVGTLLPLYTVSVFGLSQSVSYIQGSDGIVVLILAIVALIMIFADKLEDKVAFFGKLKNPKLTLIPVAISALLLIISVSQVSGSGYGAFFSFGIGFWLLVIGLVAAVVYPFLYKGDANK